MFEIVFVTSDNPGAACDTLFLHCRRFPFGAFFLLSSNFSRQKRFVSVPVWLLRRYCSQSPEPSRIFCQGGGSVLSRQKPCMPVPVFLLKCNCSHSPEPCQISCTRTKVHCFHCLNDKDDDVCAPSSVSYTHLTLPTNREV